MKKLVVVLAVCVFPAMLSALTVDEALKFLYSTMSLPDSVDYSKEFYRENVEWSMRARREMPWGDAVPEREFLHFVLPVRVNNEHLDTSRVVFYNELRDRVKGLSMEDAILEVNHWCHEKVTYRPSDGRTSSPLSAVSQAIGRCGEESTFAVAALRSVGIPARQIYTPRWAHTDDNHAWVEAWANGRWHFLGACEPEPVLDLGWFNAPAARGLLMTTDVPGHYRGEEEELSRNGVSTRINITSNYAPVDTLRVVVTDVEGHPVPAARVKFCIYNYAEFFPAVTKLADDEGRAALTTGQGDMVVWASDGRLFGMAKGRAGNHELRVVLDKTGEWEGTMELDVVPPVSRGVSVAVNDEMRGVNTRRMAQEDSIRMTYTNTFATEGSAREAARRLGVDGDALVKILMESRGNHGRIVKCMEEMDAGSRGEAVALLLAVSEKDRRDIDPAVIADHVANAPQRGDMPQELYDNYVLNPRIELEHLTPWRGLLTGVFDKAHSEDMRRNPELLAAWVRENVADGGDENPKRLRMSPEGVWRSRRADNLSADIFFVAAARSLGIAARIDPVTGRTEYSKHGDEWIPVKVRGAVDTTLPAVEKGWLKITFTPMRHLPEPRYYTHFTLSAVNDGEPHLLEYDEDATLGSIFGDAAQLEAGQYMLTTGQRLADGGVMALTTFFQINAGDTTTMELKLRRDTTAINVIGSLNAENIYHNIASGADGSLLATTGRGYYVLGIIEPNHEPSTHALNDISAVAGKLEALGRPMVLLFDSKEKAERFDASAFPLPEGVSFGIDTDGTTERELITSLNLEDVSHPLFVIADTFNRVVWVSTGYTIGIGEAILSVLSQLE